jgi:hypothetical protein
MCPVWQITYDSGCPEVKLVEACESVDWVGKFFGINDTAAHIRATPSQRDSELTVSSGKSLMLATSGVKESKTSGLISGIVVSWPLLIPLIEDKLLATPIRAGKQ